MNEKRKEMQGFAHVSRMKQYYRGDESSILRREAYKRCAYESNTENQTVRYETTDSTSTSVEKKDDAENYQLTPSEKNNDSTQKYKKDQTATNLPTSQDNTMEIPDKKKSIEQPANNVYFIEKIKGHVKNVKTEFLIKWKNFPHGESTWEPEENVFHKQIIASYFKEHSRKGTRCVTNVCAIVQLGRQHDQGLNVFQGWEILHRSLLVGFILNVIFTNSSLATNVKPDLGPLFDCTKAVPLGIFDNPTLMSSGILCRSFHVYNKGHKIPYISLQIC